ncbi:hypothetical protein N780_15855 [Pontibacillus chungwhensis BH030062]|uniref:Uncharacterized protein n=1 Tax=Pontibacillus chungwhensis BH030062 TaxID=1385513 RepID=A0A0A2VDW6_9BACI|nr:hypothetical protein [Pontibacillus chungwhensis]KGP91835.1 hypothetical protein N780_15855 [Pontibacillus chungwhensis BH030062]
MSHHMYDRCCRYKGRVVRLESRGRVHVGEVTRVTRSHVWIRPVGGQRGLGWGYYGFGYGGFGVPFALGAITGIALAGAFLW